MKRVKDIYISLGVEEYANKQMQLYYSKVKEALASIKTPEKDILIGLTEALLDRDK